MEITFMADLDLEGEEIDISTMSYSDLFFMVFGVHPKEDSLPVAVSVDGTLLMTNIEKV